MKSNDLDFALHLIDLVGWSLQRFQVEELLLFDDDCGIIVEVDSQPIGMIIAINYENFGFIGNFIVLPEFRKKGIGSTLFDYSIKHLESKGIQTIGLDGVLDAVKLYKKHGFKSQTKSLRVIVKVPPSPEKLENSHSSIHSMTEELLEQVYELDNKHFKADRSKLLELVFRNNKDYCYVILRNGKVTAYIMAVPQKERIAIGPWVAENNEVEAAELLRKIGEQTSPLPLRLPILQSNKRVLKILEQFDHSVNSYAIRMVKGVTITDSQGYLALAGPDRG